MTILESIQHDLDRASTTSPEVLLRQCVAKRLIACDQRNNNEVDNQIRELMIKFDRLPLSDMGRFIKKLSRSLNKHYVDYTKQLIAYRNSLNSKR